MCMSTISTGHSNFRDEPTEEITADGSESVPFQNAALTKSGKLCQFALFMLHYKYHTEILYNYDLSLSSLSSLRTTYVDLFL